MTSSKSYTSLPARANKSAGDALIITNMRHSQQRHFPPPKAILSLLRVPMLQQFRWQINSLPQVPSKQNEQTQTQKCEALQSLRLRCRFSKPIQGKLQLTLVYLRSDLFLLPVNFFANADHSPSLPMTIDQIGIIANCSSQTRASPKIRDARFQKFKLDSARLSNSITLFCSCLLFPSSDQHHPNKLTFSNTSVQINPSFANKKPSIKNLQYKTFNQFLIHQQDNFQCKTFDPKPSIPNFPTKTSPQNKNFLQKFSKSSFEVRKTCPTQEEPSH